MRFLLPIGISLFLVLTGCSWLGGAVEDVSDTVSDTITTVTDSLTELDMSEFFADEATLTEEQILEQYFEATEADVHAILTGKHKFAAFFYDSDCLSCQELDEEITNSLENLSDEVLIAKINFNNALGLRNQYGITYESSVVIIKENGDIQDVLLSPDLEQILMYFN